MANFFKDLFFGKSPQIKQQQNYSPEQQNFMNMILQSAQSGNQNALDWLNSLFDDEEGMEDFERPAMEQFNEQIVPNILERFRGGNSKNSSGLQQTLGQAAKGLSSNLSAQRSGIRQNAINALQNYSGIGLNKQTTPYQTSGTQGVFDMLSQGIGSAGGRAIGGGLF